MLKNQLKIKEANINEISGREHHMIRLDLTEACISRGTFERRVELVDNKLFSGRLSMNLSLSLSI